MPWRPKQHRPQGVERRRTPHTKTTKERGYDYAWQKFRLRRLAEQPTCQDCEERDIARPATEVHHLVKIKDDPSKRLDEENTRCLCGPCHDARTARGE